MCPRPSYPTFVHLDTRVGGSLRIDIDEGGSQLSVTGHYLALDRPHRIQFSWNWTAPEPATPGQHRHGHPGAPWGWTDVDDDPPGLGTPRPGRTLPGRLDRGGPPAIELYRQIAVVNQPGEDLLQCAGLEIVPLCLVPAAGCLVVRDPVVGGPVVLAPRLGTNTALGGSTSARPR